MARSTKRVFFAAVALIGGSVVFDAYARFPASFQLAPLQLDPAVHTAVLLFHGTGGRNEPTIVALEARARQLLDGRSGVAVLRYVWSPYSDNRFRAGVNGERVGQLLGADLARLPALESVHIIAHSAGAYIPGPLCQALKKSAARPLRVDITYVDPMGIRGALDFGWGARNFGRCGDYVEAFINTDDPVPGTNDPLKNSWNVDVTADANRSTYAGGGHRWPMQYYLDTVSAEDLLPGAHSQEIRPRGAVERR